MREPENSMHLNGLPEHPCVNPMIRIDVPPPHSALWVQEYVEANIAILGLDDLTAMAICNRRPFNHS
jgi:hypothetical protein